MKISFEFPTEIRRFARKECIRIQDVKNKILSAIEEVLLDRDYKSIKLKKIRIVVNGIHKNQKKRIFISANKISKKKPLKTVSASGMLDGYSVCYLIYKE